jgi:hypothetical protein
MSGKIIAFQKMIYQMLFCTSDTNKQIYKNKSKIIEFFMLIIFPVIVFIVGANLLDSLLETFAFDVLLLQFLYRAFCLNQDYFYHLPLKKSFVVINIYIFSTSVFFICALLFFYLSQMMNMYSVFTSFLTGNANNFKINRINIVMFQELIFSFFYATTYMNAIIVSFFAKKEKFRIAIIIFVTAIYCGLTLYIHNILPKDPKQDYSNTLTSLMQIPNLWVYILIAFCITVCVTISSIFIAIKLD